MYRIGDFSKITQLSVKTLRYYDEIQILSPSLRDEQTHYRYYSEEDFQQAQMLKLLRSLDFSIMEIKDILATLHDVSDLSFYIQEKQEFIRQEIKEKEVLIAQMNALLHHDPTTCEKHPYEISQAHCDPCLVAAYRYRGSYPQITQILPMMYKEIKGNASGEPAFNLYYDDSYEEAADIEVCVPVKKQFAAKQCKVKHLPAMSGLATYHKGPYDQLYMAYKALLDYAQVQHYTSFVPVREIYVKGPGRIFRGNPDTYVTQIIIPCEEDS